MSRAVAVVFPDAAELACSWLSSNLPEHGFTSVPVGTRVPTPRPSTSFVRVLRTGGPRDTVVTDAAQLTIEAWAPDEGSACDLSQMCRALLQYAVGEVVNGSTICGYEEFTGPQNLPDPTSAMPRYSFTIRWRVRGAPLT